MAKKKTEIESIEPNDLSEDASIYENNSIISEEDFVSTGSTVLNLMLTGNKDLGFKMGSIIRLQGPEGSGKTASCGAFMSAICKDAKFKKHNLEYRDHEGGLTLDLDKLYGRDVAERLKVVTPDGDRSSLEAEFQFIRMNTMEGAQSVITEDSLDMLVSAKYKALLEANGDRALSGEELKEGAMGVNSRTMSDGFKLITGTVRNSRSLLFLISQVRETMDMFAVDKKFNTSGGNALKHAASVRLAYSTNPGKDAIIKEVRGNKIQVGQRIGVEILKNRSSGLTNRGNPIYLYLYFNRGFYDEESVLNFLINTTKTVPDLTRGWFDATTLYGSVEPIKKRYEEMVADLRTDKEFFARTRDLAQSEWNAMQAELASVLY